MDHRLFSYKSTIVVILFVVGFLVAPVPASVYVSDGTGIAAEELITILRENPDLTRGPAGAGKVIFFTNSHCGACKRTQEYIDSFALTHSEITLETYDLASGADSLAVYEKYKQLYHREYLSTPSVMIGNLTLEGGQDIRDHLEEIVSVQQELES